MVTKKPTTIVQIMSQSDIMRSNQNYKINKKIWELIEEGKTSGGETPSQELEERIAALEARAYDDTDLKEKMGYSNIPSGESLMSQILDLQASITDEPQVTTQQEP